ncbi:MAG: DUF4350 domain-containing protein [Verrucomicrobiota bacterium]
MFGLFALGVVLCVGFLEVIEKRFAEGGVYPHYASFRSDPLGTSALYESLSNLPEVSVKRNVTGLDRIRDLDGNTALLLLGLPRENLADLRESSGGSPVLEAVRSGARLVVTVNPGLVPEKFLPARSDEEEDWFERRRKLREDRIRSEKKGEEGDLEEKEKDFEKAMDEALGERLTEKFGFRLESLEEFERPEEGWELKPGPKTEVRALPDWFSQFRFRKTGKGWKTIARAEGGPVVIEKRLGKGSLVFASDSFFVSNEALHLSATPEFLVWLLGGKTNIVFDETIHGVREVGGAMVLMRRYRVHGVFFGLILFVALWAWRSSSPLAPSEADTGRGLAVTAGAVTGEETSSGLTRLLQRSIAPNELLRQCVELWSESRSREIPKSVEKKVSGVLQKYEPESRSRDAVTSYREISEWLRRR